MNQKKAALELSVGTIVVIVIAMSMLILGLVLVRTIFTSATSSVDSVDDKLREEIQGLFKDNNKKTVVYLASNTAEIEQGEAGFGVAFAFRNLNTGTTQGSTFSYQIISSDVSSCAGLTNAAADAWLGVGKTASNLALPPGELFATVVKLNIPDTAPLCTVRYNIEISQNGQPYALDFFDVEVQAN